MNQAASVDFHFPDGATAPLALRINTDLYSTARGQELMPYFGALDTRYEAYLRPAWSARWRAVFLGARIRGRSIRVRDVRPWKGDVLMVGECGRATEMELMLRLIEATVREGLSVLYVSATEEEDVRMRSAGVREWPGRATFERIEAPSAPSLETALRTPLSRTVRRDWADIASALSRARASLDAEGIQAAWEIAAAKLLIARMRGLALFRFALTRTTYLPLSAALLGAALPDRVTISFQHSVVTCPASHVPIPARRLVCFGSTSRALLERMDLDVTRAAGRSSVCDALIEAGSFVDRVPPPRAAAPSRENATVLVIDQTSDWVERYFGGTSDQFASLPRAVRSLLRLGTRIKRLVIRLHPSYDASSTWRDVVARGERASLSPRDRSLDEDLAAASVVVGLFSTALPVAAAAGIPTVFLWKEGWYRTPDLAPFSSLTSEPNDLASCIDGILGDPSVFDDWAARARRAAEDYFLGGRTCEFGPDLVRRVYAP